MIDSKLIKSSLEEKENRKQPRIESNKEHSSHPSTDDRQVRRQAVKSLTQQSLESNKPLNYYYFLEKENNMHARTKPIHTIFHDIIFCSVYLIARQIRKKAINNKYKNNNLTLIFIHIEHIYFLLLFLLFLFSLMIHVIFACSSAIEQHRFHLSPRDAALARSSRRRCRRRSFHSIVGSLSLQLLTVRVAIVRRDCNQIRSNRRR